MSNSFISLSIESEIKDKFNVLFELTANQNKLNKINPQNFIEECKDIGEQIHCLKCSFFSLNSVQCSNCEYLICEDCSKDIKECLLCESKFIPKKIDKTLLRVIQEIKVNCINSNLCPKIKVKEYKEHLLKCDYADFLCLTCKKVISGKKECIEHAKICGYSNRKCKYCSIDIRYYEKEKHETKCGEQFVPCPLCKIQVKNKNLIAHKKKECEMRIIKCQECSQEFPYKNKKYHTMEKCKNNQINYWKQLYLKEKERNKKKSLAELLDSSMLSMNSIDNNNQNDNDDGNDSYKEISNDDDDDDEEDDYDKFINFLETPKTKKGLSKSPINNRGFNNKQLINNSSYYPRYNYHVKRELNIESEILLESEKDFLIDCFPKFFNVQFKLKFKMYSNIKCENFHEECDNIGPTLTLLKIKEKENENGKDNNNNIRLGGYASVSFDNKSNEKYDKHAFIFSLNFKKKFRTKIPDKSIFCHEDFGPFFGGNNEHPQLWTYGNTGGMYCHEFYDDKDYLCTKGLNNFFVEKIEVFKVIIKRKKR